MLACLSYLISGFIHFCFVFFHACPAPHHLHSFPTRRSSDLNPNPVGDTPRSKPASEIRSSRKGVTAPDDAFRLGRSHLCDRSEEHTSELQSRLHLVCRLLLEKKKKRKAIPQRIAPKAR